jgi:hypothetical protein
MHTTKIKVNAAIGWEYFQIKFVTGFCKHFLMNICVIKTRKFLDRVSRPKKVHWIYYKLKPLETKFLYLIALVEIKPVNWKTD